MSHEFCDRSTCGNLATPSSTIATRRPNSLLEGIHCFESCSPYSDLCLFLEGKRHQGVPLLNNEAMTTAFNKRQATKVEVRAIQDTHYSWALEKGVGAKATQSVVNCFEKSFLLSLPSPEEKHYLPGNPSTRNLRYLCMRYIVRLVGWTRCRVKGRGRQNSGWR